MKMARALLCTWACRHSHLRRLSDDPTSTDLKSTASTTEFDYKANEGYIRNNLGNQR